MSEAKSCAACAHWRELTRYRGQCLKAPYTASSYREIGVLDRAETYEETRPDYHCTLFAERPS